LLHLAVWILGSAMLASLPAVPPPALAVAPHRGIISRGASPDLSGQIAVASIESAIEVTPWERDRTRVLVTVFILVAQTTLIFLLVRVGHRRRQTQKQLQGRLRFERALAELSASLASVPPQDIDGAVDVALSRVASSIEIDWLWRWDFGIADAGWDSARLRAGECDRFTSCAELPPTVRQRLHDAGCVDASAIAVPLAPAAAISGAVFWISRSARRAPPERLDELQMLAAAVAAALRQKEAEGALERSDRLKGAILASLPAHVAVLNRDGAIIAVNDARGDLDYGSELPGAIALVSQRGRDGRPVEGSAVSAEITLAVAIIDAVCRGESAGRPVEYRCDRGPTERWFLMTAQPLRGDERGAVVTHLEITARKAHEIALRESEGRFRRMADALPVAIWMSDTQGLLQYVNRQWLEMTGRTHEEESGSGWLDSVHPEDAARAMDVFLEAHRTGQSFHNDYRIRRQDGEYRWYFDTGVPRYGSDGAFHGYVGGCVDITERKDSERLLRDLSRRLMMAQDDERRRIARELHDHLSQQLALLAIDLQQLSSHPPASPIDAGVVLQNAWRRTTEIASDVHGISHRLHPSKMEALGLVATIRAHCRDVSRQSLAVRFDERNVPAGIPPERALSLFRVVEEALSNVARHSGASEARVTLLGVDGSVVLRIADNGTGFLDSPKLGAGLGLVSMRERVESLSGTLSIVSAPGQGATVEARVLLAALRDAPPHEAPVRPPVRRRTAVRPPSAHRESA
jgi:PAS domain S-box-containing protein